MMLLAASGSFTCVGVTPRPQKPALLYQRVVATHGKIRTIYDSVGPVLNK